MEETSIPQCKLCHAALRQPRMLPCMHTFCQTCLSLYIIKTVDTYRLPRRRKFACPLCKRESTPENPADRKENWAQQLPMNTYALQKVKVKEQRLSNYSLGKFLLSQGSFRGNAYFGQFPDIREKKTLVENNKSKHNTNETKVDYREMSVSQKFNDIDNTIKNQKLNGTRKSAEIMEDRLNVEKSSNKDKELNKNIEDWLSISKIQNKDQEFNTMKSVESMKNIGSIDKNKDNNVENENIKEMTKLDKKTMNSLQNPANFLNEGENFDNHPKNLVTEVPEGQQIEDDVPENQYTFSDPEKQLSVSEDEEVLESEQEREVSKLEQQIKEAETDRTKGDKKNSEITKVNKVKNKLPRIKPHKCKTDDNPRALERETTEMKFKRCTDAKNFDREEMNRCRMALSFVRQNFIAETVRTLQHQKRYNAVSLEAKYWKLRENNLWGSTMVPPYSTAFYTPDGRMKPIPAFKKPIQFRW